MPRGHPQVVLVHVHHALRDMGRVLEAKQFLDDALSFLVAGMRFAGQYELDWAVPGQQRERPVGIVYQEPETLVRRVTISRAVDPADPQPGHSSLMQNPPLVTWPNNLPRLAPRAENPPALPPSFR